MTRIGIIGCGGIAKFHYEGYERAGAKIVHVCDIHKPAAEAVGARYGAKVSTDFRAVCDDKDVDLVSVCSIANNHKDACIAAAQAGKAIVCEKTLTDSADSSLAIVQAVRKAKVFFGTAYMKNFFPAFKLARQMLADMGPVTSLYARTWQPSGGWWVDPLPAWALEKPSGCVQKYGGGVLVCGGSHILNQVCNFGGRPVRLVGQKWTRPGVDERVDLRTDAMLWLPNDGICHFEAHWHPFSNIGYERNGWDERFEINTPKGRLELYTVLWNKPMNNGALLVHHDAVKGTTTEHRFHAVNAFDVEMADMLKAYESGQPAFPSVQDGYAVDELIAHIDASSAAGGKVIPVKYRD